MANKGSSRHMKSLTTSKYYAVHKKESAYSAKPSPGRHTLDRSIPLLAMATKAGLSATSHDANSMIKKGELRVNGKQIRNPRYPVGLNDIVESVPAKKSFLVGINERGQVSITDSKGKERLCKIVQKYKAQKGTLMIRLHDGMVLKAGKDTCVNDSVLVGNDNSIKKVLKLGNGSRCTIIAGVHVGASGTVKEIHAGTSTSKAYVTVEQGGNKGFDTLLKNIMVVE